MSWCYEAFLSLGGLLSHLSPRLVPLWSVLTTIILRSVKNLSLVREIIALGTLHSTGPVSIVKSFFRCVDFFVCVNSVFDNPEPPFQTLFVLPQSKVFFWDIRMYSLLVIIDSPHNYQFVYIQNKTRYGKRDATLEWPTSCRSVLL